MPRPTNKHLSPIDNTNKRYICTADIMNLIVTSTYREPLHRSPVNKAPSKSDIPMIIFSIVICNTVDWERSKVMNMVQPSPHQQHKPSPLERIQKRTYLATVEA